MCNRESHGADGTLNIRYLREACKQWKRPTQPGPTGHFLPLARVHWCKTPGCLGTIKVNMPCLPVFYARPPLANPSDNTRMCLLSFGLH